ncbi:hypothetical protein ACTNEA_12360 [Oscillospiraceae bacterium HCP3S3_F4]
MGQHALRYRCKRQSYNRPLHIANINPIRYRGYYYDAETGLYYLQSRYYEFKYEGNWEKNI